MYAKLTIFYCFYEKFLTIPPYAHTSEGDRQQYNFRLVIEVGNEITISIHIPYSRNLADECNF